MHAKKTNKTKVLAVVLALVLLVGGAIGGTLAWLTDKTEDVVNVFTESDVDITLTENTGNSYKMVPGATITKDPVVTVLANSEACWVFVKIEKSTDKAFDDYMTFTVAEGWTALPTDSTVYYRAVPASAANQDFNVIKDNTVTVKDTVTKGMMDALNAANYPKLTFTAYAIQQAKGEGTFTAEQAWEEVKPAPANP